jgi:hypothetical protein
MNNGLLKVGVWDFVRWYIFNTSEPCVLCQQPQTPRDNAEVLGCMGQLIVMYYMGGDWKKNYGEQKYITRYIKQH